MLRCGTRIGELKEIESQKSIWFWYFSEAKVEDIGAGTGKVLLGRKIYLNTGINNV